MSVSGPCQVCETAIARARCERCGALVCTRHLSEDGRTCVDCARGGPQLD